MIRPIHPEPADASPVRPGEYVERQAEIDLLGARSALPGGKRGAEHSSDNAPCSLLRADISAPDENERLRWQESTLNGCDRSQGGGHGTSNGHAEKG